MEYCKPKDLGEALDILAKRGGKAHPLAGGTDVVADLRAEKITPELLVDLKNIRELSSIHEEDGLIHIGAMTTIQEIANSPILDRGAGMLTQAARSVGGPQIRNRATLGGNLIATAPAPPCLNRKKITDGLACTLCARACVDNKKSAPPPYGDLVAPLLALDAKVHLRSALNRREVHLEEFLKPPRTDRKNNELIMEVSFKKLAENQRGVFFKCGARRVLAVSLVSGAVTASVAPKGRIEEARVAVAGGTPVKRASRAEEILSDSPLNEQTIYRAAQAASQDYDPVSDIRASAEYRKELCRVWLERSLGQLLYEVKH